MIQTCTIWNWYFLHSKIFQTWQGRRSIPKEQLSILAQLPNLSGFQSNNPGNKFQLVFKKFDGPLQVVIRSQKESPIEQTFELESPWIRDLLWQPLQKGCRGIVDDTISDTAPLGCYKFSCSGGPDAVCINSASGHATLNLWEVWVT
jgi:hypothetical protein